MSKAPSLGHDETKSKRGRPLSTPSNDPALQRRREQSARRNRTYYERQLQARCWRGPLPLKMQQRRYAAGCPGPEPDAGAGSHRCTADDHYTLYDSDDHLETADQLSDPRVLSPPCSVTPPQPRCLGLGVPFKLNRLILHLTSYPKPSSRSAHSGAPKAFPGPSG